MPKLYDAGRHFRAFISCTTDDCIALVTFLSPIFSKLHEHMNQCAHKSYLNYILNFSFEDRFSPKTPKVFGLLLLLVAFAFLVWTLQRGDAFWTIGFIFHFYFRSCHSSGVT